ncbi:transporter substrate-binding domain-containing protein [Undibacterium cyanobacteriorum]|uniref:Transporter substrate-binding domain-containing protein n=1 Tax=Undibacterium cyanobacteriorum TaxID=3073561 RepID=A0ABY9RH47_9BURK|nr:transporter substrate-binding domain-containing protein [Undibacterium sp. 20NA77.5]WMW80540.1 transporter substrate-binding domain-containing protein [Undibacterium sp. 20NA77.5]
MFGFRLSLVIMLGLLGALGLCASSIAAQVMQITYPADEEPGDPRFKDVKEILRVALEKTVPEFGPFHLRASAQQTNGLRYLSNLARESDLNVVWSSTTVEKEQNYLPIRIPLRKGIMGYRLLLVHKDKQELFRDIKTLDDLKKLSVGQGVGWDDIKLYKAAGMNVVEAKYSNLFRMLSYHRFDAFPRGINEIFNELDKESLANPDLRIDENLLIYYPWPYYFFVAQANTKLRDRLELGLRKMMKDGSFDAIFWKYNGKSIEDANFKKRRVIYLKNHLLPKETPLNDPTLWYRPKLN